VTQFYDAALRPSGLHATQFTLLQAIESAGGLRQADLAGLLAMDSTTLSRTLKLLEREFLIQGSPGKDRRERLFRLTPRGRKLLARARARWGKAQQRLQGAVGRSGWSRLLEALDRATLAARRISP